jgi:hypothetical protein
MRGASDRDAATVVKILPFVLAQNRASALQGRNIR